MEATGCSALKILYVIENRMYTAKATGRRGKEGSAAQSAAQAPSIGWSKGTEIRHGTKGAGQARLRTGYSEARERTSAQTALRAI